MRLRGTHGGMIQDRLQRMEMPIEDSTFVFTLAGCALDVSDYICSESDADEGDEHKWVRIALRPAAASAEVDGVEDEEADGVEDEEDEEAALPPPPTAAAAAAAAQIEADAFRLALARVQVELDPESRGTDCIVATDSVPAERRAATCRELGGIFSLCPSFNQQTHAHCNVSSITLGRAGALATLGNTVPFGHDDAVAGAHAQEARRVQRRIARLLQRHNVNLASLARAAEAEGISGLTRRVLVYYKYGRTSSSQQARRMQALLESPAGTAVIEECKLVSASLAQVQEARRFVRARLVHVPIEVIRTRAMLVQPRAVRQRLQPHAGKQLDRLLASEGCNTRLEIVRILLAYKAHLDQGNPPPDVPVRYENEYQRRKAVAEQNFDLGSVARQARSAWFLDQLVQATRRGRRFMGPMNGGQVRKLVVAHMRRGVQCIKDWRQHS